MNSIIKQETSLCRLKLDTAVPDKDRQFLSSFYSLDEVANWHLVSENECYRLIDTQKGLSLCIDLAAGNYRHRNQNAAKESLLTAIKINKKLPESLIDATPGVLKDSFLIASRGVRVTAIERHPLLYVMVNKALEQVACSIDYHFGDSYFELSRFTADIIYLDPMFPPQKKSAKVKKDMQILHDIVGFDEDANQLLMTARKQNCRVVVKRPTHAKPLAALWPNSSYAQGRRGVRYDIYLP